MFSDVIQEMLAPTRRLETVVFDEALLQRFPGIEVRRAPFAFGMQLLSADENQVCTTKRISYNFSQRVYYPEGMGDLHRHDYIELVYVCEGTYRIRTETQLLSFHEKELCIMDRAFLHQEDFRDTSFTALFIEMSTELFDSVFLSRIESMPEKELSDFIINALYNSRSGAGYLRLSAKQYTVEVESCLEKMICELEQRRSGYDFICKGYLTRLIDVLTPEVYSALNTEDKRLFQRRLYEKVMDYMTGHMDTVTLEELVQAFHFQKDYFNRLIRKYAKCSFTEVLQRIRISRAEYLLAHTELPVSELVLQIGYRNVTYFYRIFAARHGMTPAAYRERARQEMSPEVNPGG